jgi:hypothetical protein
MTNIVRFSNSIDHSQVLRDILSGTVIEHSEAQAGCSGSERIEATVLLISDFLLGSRQPKAAPANLNRAPWRIIEA